MLSHLHFLHPLRLLALPPLLAFAAWLARRRARDGAWPRVMDGELLPALRLEEAGRGRSPWPLLASAWTLAVLALAGPSWQRQVTAAYRLPAAWVLALELSPSMNATDVPPSRVARARFAIDDLLSAAHDARVGLVAFAGDAYTVAPLTTDVATVQNLSRALSPGLMPEHGKRLAPALRTAARLLRSWHGKDRQVIVLADGLTDPARALLAAEQLRREGMTLSIVGVGTAAGAPAPNGKGGFRHNAQGQIVMTRLQAGILRRIAAAGGGTFVTLDQLPQLIADLHARGLRSLGSAAAAPGVRLASWLDGGIWLLPPLLLCAALLSRRGWI